MLVRLQKESMDIWKGAVVCFLVIGLTSVTGQCPGKADIMFLVPGSDAVPGHEFFPFERFLINLVSFFNIDRDNVNVGLILYGKTPVPFAWPQPFKSQKQINTRITLMSQRLSYADELNGGNNLTAALSLMRKMFTNPTGQTGSGRRNNARQIGVVFTYDSVSIDERQSVIEAAKAARGDGITLYGVGKGQAGPEFSHIGSDYCKSFSMGRFIDGLPSVLAFLGSSLCSEMNPNVNVTELNCFPQLYQSKEPEPVQCDGRSLLFPDPENCAYFYHCRFRRPVQERCSTGMLFDPSASACNYKEFVSCYTDIKCPMQNGLFPHPTDCSKYINCFDFRPYVQKCPNNMWFDATTKGCGFTAAVACT
ncbi:CO6A5-like protein [Mya arenaria]|uniref:CO6A5-like protein n=1 Tax=Mya arenaria TaxID=6604 RepID=A0ABY7E569_MYAAR|nr:collagen alpha-6(VI) chain-like [Mya arenaria]WAR03544.1 CO6A5-like protein [Mya arenaria]